MSVPHEPWLVALSLVVAIQGAFVGLSLSVQVADATGVRRRLLLAGAALSVAVAIWSMHFVAMLAVRLPFQIDYLALPTLLSFLVCVIVVGFAVFAASAGPPTLARLAASAGLMGIGVFTMHYIGMTALHASVHMDHAWPLVALSLVIAVGTSGLALWLATGRSGRPPLILSATALGFAIAGMHYTAMAGLTVVPHGNAPSGAPALSTDLLAIVVAVVAFIVSGIFLLILVPDREKAEAGTATEAAAAAPSGGAGITAAAPLAVVAAPGEAGIASAAPASGKVPVVRDATRLGQGTYAPLGGAGAPPRRPAQRLPVEREGATQFVAVDDIVAVHANAHYTYIFSGTVKLFCPLAIGEVESRLDAARFARVHRSHIVNLDHVIGLKRTGDAAVVELAAPDAYPVPVARNRVTWLKSRIGSKLDRVAS
jgi:NO-binding membrane sensor protein with MHYT domain